MTNMLEKAIRNFNIQDWYDLGLRKELYSNFVDRDIKKQLLPLINESKELQEALDSGNIDEVKKEYGDVIYALMLLTSGLIKEGILTEEDFRNMGKQQKSKIYARSSFLKQNKKVSIDEEENERFASKGQPKRPI